MELTLVFTFFSLIIAPIAFFGQGSRPDISAGIVALVVAVISVGAYFFFRKERKDAEIFLNWLVKNATEIMKKGLYYQNSDNLITPDTELVQYRATASVLVATGTFYSNFHNRKNSARFLPLVVYTLYSTVFGWWGIKGFFYNLVSIINNLKGGKKLTVNQLLTELTAAPLQAENVPFYKRKIF